VIYYYTPDNGDPGALTTSVWSAKWAETFNADSPVPTWAVTTLENAVRTGGICVAASCTGSMRFAGDFISSTIDSSGAAHLTWMRHDGGESPVLVSIRYAKLQAGPVSTFTAIPCALTPTAVSRKTHGTAGTFDINLPRLGRPGVECRTGGASGDHQIVLTFPAAVTFDHAAVTSGTGSVSSTSVNGRNITVNLTGVADGQTVTVTLFAVSDTVTTGDVALQMSVLSGDTNGDTFVNSADISQTKGQSGQLVNASNFREDVTADGFLNSGDISLVKSRSGTALP
jgi:hypothetical protein